MLRKLSIIAFAVAVLATPIVAGEEGYRCEQSAQDCLNYMAKHLKERGWAGVEMDHAEDGTLSVKEVYAGTPADQAGVKVGDVLVAIDGVQLAEENKAELQKVEAQMKPGNTVNFTIARKGKERDLSITLEPMPEDMLAKYIGKHMLEHATVEVASN